MSGDGMTDIVRIRNGEVCFWPNLGYGKFGAKVTLDHSPTFDLPDAFNPSLIRLADIDGSGTTDIIYLGRNKFTVWKNLSGNCFGKTALRLIHFLRFIQQPMLPLPTCWAMVSPVSFGQVHSQRTPLRH